MPVIGLKFGRVSPGRWRRGVLRAGCLLLLLVWAAVALWLLEEGIRIVVEFIDQAVRGPKEGAATHRSALSSLPSERFEHRRREARRRTIPGGDGQPGRYLYMRW